MQIEITTDTGKKWMLQMPGEELHQEILKIKGAVRLPNEAYPEEVDEREGLGIDSHGDFVNAFPMMQVLHQICSCDAEKFADHSLNWVEVPD